MILLALLLVVSAAPARISLIDEPVTVPPGEMMGVNVTLQQKHAVIEVRFDVTGDKPDVTVALLGPADAANPLRYLREVRSVPEGVIRFPAANRGTYQIVVDNRANTEQAAEVQLNVDVIFDEPGTLRPVELDPVRRSIVVASSVTFFLLISLWSGRRVVASFRRRR